MLTFYLEKITVKKKQILASEVCPLTCGICNQVPSIPPSKLPTRAPDSSPGCEDNDIKKFYFKTKTDSSGNLIPVLRGCLWLRSKSLTVQVGLCNQPGEFGLSSTSDICRQTCNSC